MTPMTSYTVRWLVLDDEGTRLHEEDLQITAATQAAALRQATEHLATRVLSQLPEQLQVALFTVPNPTDPPGDTLYICLAPNPSQWHANELTTGDTRPLTPDELAHIKDLGPGIYWAENEKETRK